MDKLTEYMKDLQESAVLEEIKTRAKAGADPLSILDALQEGMRLVGEEYEAGRYYLSELIMSSSVFKSAVALINDQLTAQSSEPKYGALVIGTVKEDIHDIGKDIVATLLGCQGFKVVDLGVDVPPEAFVAAVKEHKPTILGLSCLLTTAFESMKATIEAMEAEGLREGLSVMIGGATITDETVKYVGADVCCLDANTAVRTAQKLAGGAA